MRDGRSLRYRWEELTILRGKDFVARAPSVTFGDSSLPEGAFGKKHSALTFYL